MSEDRTRGANGGSRFPGLSEIEEQVEELERLTNSLGDVPEEELTASLDRAVELLAGINSGIESELKRADAETRDLENALGEVEFAPFDETLSELEKRERRMDG